MATATLPPPPIPDPNASNSAGSFSPLTLFECTMTNAGMLVDSMPVRDLVSALRIIGTLHTHVVNIMDPGVAAACDLADQFNAHRVNCPTAAADASAAENDATPDVSRDQIDDSPKADSSSMDGGGGGAKKRMKLDDNSMGSLNDHNNSTADHQPRNSNSAVSASASAAFVKSESIAESDDDCCILDDGGLGIIGSDFYTSMQQPHQQRLHPASMPQISAAAGSAASASAYGSVQDSTAMKQILRNTYKAMRAGGPHLYDFNRPWNDPSNQAVTERIVSQIVATTPDISASPDDWRTQMLNLLPDLQQRRDTQLKKIRDRKYCRSKRLLSGAPAKSESQLKYEARKRSMRKYARVSSKLSRRQKAFEQVLPSLNPDDLDKYRIVLSRDFTSSDEETDDESTGETALRVRELIWESDEVRQIKQRLDQTFMNRFATQKQRATLQRCIRDPACTSSRTPPAEAPNWALRQPE